jgi:hypothetical protein
MNCQRSQKISSEMYVIYSIHTAIIHNIVLRVPRNKTLVGPLRRSFFPYSFRWNLRSRQRQLHLLSFISFLPFFSLPFILTLNTRTIEGCLRSFPTFLLYTADFAARCSRVSPFSALTCFCVFVVVHTLLSLFVLSLENQLIP